MIVTLAPEVDEIVAELLSPSMDWVRIVSVFVEKKSSRWEACISKIGPVFKELTGYDLVLKVLTAAWAGYDDNQKEALIYHELCHVAVDEEKGEKKIYLVPHYVEAFPEVVEKYGLWHPHLQKMGDVVEQTIMAERQKLQKKDNKKESKIKVAVEKPVKISA